MRQKGYLPLKHSVRQTRRREKRKRSRIKQHLLGRPSLQQSTRRGERNRQQKELRKRQQPRQQTQSRGWPTRVRSGRTQRWR